MSDRVLAVCRTFTSLVCALAALVILAPAAEKALDVAVRVAREQLTSAPIVSVEAESAEPAFVMGQERVLAVFSPDLGQGHLCVVGSTTEAYTAKHVAEVARYLTWADELGNSGVVTAQWSDARRDLAVVSIVDGTQPFPSFLTLAREEPSIGSVVYIVGFDKSLNFRDITVRAKVVEIRGGLLTYDASPGSGSSGSCVLNEDGEVVGVNVAVDGTGVGLGVLLTGQWGEVPEAFRVAY